MYLIFLVLRLIELETLPVNEVFPSFWVEVAFIDKDEIGKFLKESEKDKLSK